MKPLLTNPNNNLKIAMSTGLEQYPLLDELIRAAPLNELGPGRPQQFLIKRLEAISDDELLSPFTCRAPRHFAAVRAGLLLLADDLEGSHVISQDLADATGSYWHGIMHRREPDDGNACYWFARVGRHPVTELLPAAVNVLLREFAELTTDRAIAEMTTRGKWQAEAFVTLCSRARRQPESALSLFCRKLQQRECRLLLAYCVARVAGD